MAAVKNRIVTVRSYKDGKEQLTKKTVKGILGIGHYYTLTDSMNALGISLNKPMNWDDVKRLLALQMYLKNDNGRVSKQMFVYMEKKRMLDAYFKQAGINLETQFSRVKIRYEAKNPPSGVVRYHSNPGYSNLPKVTNASPAMV